LRTNDLVDEHEMILLDRRKVDRLVQFFGKLLQKGTRLRYEIATNGRRKTQDRGTQPHPAVWRRRDDELLGFQRRDDTLHGGPRKVHALRDLAETKPGILFLERAQNRGGARNNLNLTFVVGDQTTHDATTPSERYAGDILPPCIVGHDSPKSDTAKRKKT